MAADKDDVLFFIRAYPRNPWLNPFVSGRQTTSRSPVAQSGYGMWSGTMCSDSERARPVPTIYQDEWDCTRVSDARFSLYGYGSYIAFVPEIIVWPKLRAAPENVIQGRIEIETQHSRASADVEFTIAFTEQLVSILKGGECEETGSELLNWLGVRVLMWRSQENGDRPYVDVEMFDYVHRKHMRRDHPRFREADFYRIKATVRLDPEESYTTVREIGDFLRAVRDL